MAQDGEVLGKVLYAAEDDSSVIAFVRSVLQFNFEAY